MFRNIVIFVVAIFIALFVMSAPASAEESNYTKAENFTKIGRYSEAISALESQIAQKSDDAKAYLMLGNIHLRLNNFVGADKEFQAAITFQPSYRAEIGKKFYAAGLASLNSGEIDQAKDIFERTIKQNPAQAKNIASACLQASKKYFGISQPEKAEKLLPLILSDKTLAPQIQAERTKYGEKVLAEAKKELSEDKREIAIRYLGQKRVDAEFPPQQWLVVFSQTYVGKGIGGDNYTKTVQSGREYKKGDKLIFFGETFSFYNGVEWKEYKGRFEITIGETEEGKFIYIGAPQNAEIKLEIQRFMYPSEKEKLVSLSLNQ